MTSIQVPRPLEDPLATGERAPLMAQMLVLQATQFCNIDCQYCYIPGRSQKAQIGLDVLRAVRHKVIEGGRLAPTGLVLWHAGEPLSVGLARFQELRAELFGDGRAPGLREQVQTNATLLDDSWARYFRDHDITVGVSIDGPRWIHDVRRVDRRGKGTHHAVVRGIEALKRAGVGYTMICVVGAAGLEDPEGVFEHLRDLGPKRIGFSIEKIDGANLASTVTGASHFDDVRRFFRTVARLNEAAGNPVAIREVDNVRLGLRRSAPHRPASDEASPGRILSVSISGQVGYFSPEMITNPRHELYGDFTFGNILEDDPRDIDAAALESTLNTDIALGIARCREGCPFWRFCGGGSPSAKISEHGSAAVTETSFCVLAKQAASLGVLDAIVETAAVEA